MLHDLRIGWRSLLRSPLFTLTAAGSLALGIAACTVIFSVVYALLLRPLPYLRPAELVNIGLRTPGEPDSLGVLAPDLFKLIRHDSDSGLSTLAGFGYDYANLTGVRTPAQLTVLLVTADYFRVFGVPAARGRFFTEAECRAASAPGVVVSDHFWRSYLRGDESAVGGTITLDDKPRTVLGVMPPDFKDLNDGVELWLPLAEDSSEMADEAARRYVTVGRLADPTGAGRRKTDVYLATLSNRLVQTDPAHYKNYRLGAGALKGGVLLGSGYAHSLWLLLGAVGCVLLVTCANVANLQLIRAASRRREVGIRLALGASRWRVAGGALADSLILAGAGAGLGVLIAAWGIDALIGLLPPGISPFQDDIRLSWPVLAFAVVVAASAGALTGVLPAWLAGRQDPAGSLGVSAGRGASEGPGGVRVRAGLVVAEIALALVLLAGAGLMGRSLLAALRTDAGVRLDHTLLVNLSLSRTRYPDDARSAEFLRRVLAAVEAVPGVAGTSLTNTPLFSWHDEFGFVLPGQTTEAAWAIRQRAVHDSVNPHGFKTLGIPLRRGREFDEHDNAAAPRVAVVNEAFVRRYFPDRDPVGAVLTSRHTHLPFEIVGVVGDIRRAGLDQDAPAEIYTSYLQLPNYYATLYARSAGALRPEDLTRAVESAIWSIDPDQPIGRVTTLERAASGSVAYTRLYAALFAAFAVVTLGLAALGIYGAVSYSVGQRTHELGIRLALGAQRRDVLRLVLGQGTRLILLGLALGLVASLALAGVLKSLLYGVAPNDPVTLAFVAGLLGGVALLASYLPARRATLIDPLTALREE